MNRLLKTLWIATGMASVFALGYSLHDMVRDRLHSANTSSSSLDGAVASSEEQSLVEVSSVEGEPPSCTDPLYPVAVFVRNHGTRTLKDLFFRIDVFENGHSTNIAEPYFIVWDHILLPNTDATHCYSFPPLKGRTSANDMVAVAHTEPGTVHFYADGEHIPQRPFDPAKFLRETRPLEAEKKDETKRKTGTWEDKIRTVPAAVQSRTH